MSSNERDLKLLELIRLLRSKEFAAQKEEKRKNMAFIETGEKLVEYAARHDNDAAIIIRILEPGSEYMENPPFEDKSAYLGHSIDVVGTLVFACQWEDDSVEDDLFPLAWNGVTFRYKDLKVLVLEND